MRDDDRQIDDPVFQLCRRRKLLEVLVQSGEIPVSVGGGSVALQGLLSQIDQLLLGEVKEGVGHEQKPVGV